MKMLLFAMFSISIGVASADVRPVGLSNEELPRELRAFPARPGYSRIPEASDDKAELIAPVLRSDGVSYNGAEASATPAIGNSSCYPLFSRQTLYILMLSTAIVLASAYILK